jgi:signal transduction histidine kinase
MLYAGWVIFTLANLHLMMMYPRWETIPFHLIWAGVALFYGFRPWRAAPTLVLVSVIMVVTAGAIDADLRLGMHSLAAFTEDPLLALMFFAMVWHARRRLAAESSHRLIATQIARLLADQRRFLQDAAHQLKTPITIALGHAELLSSTLACSSAAGQQEGTDIEVIIGELNQLRRISEHLLVIAAAGDPEFLHPEPVALDRLAAGLLTRWQPTADRHWTLGDVSPVIVPADRERLSLALDALLENAVQHTASGDTIELSVTGGPPATTVRLVVADTGSGIAADQLPQIFDRFRSGAPGPSRPARGTGLGLALVDAVASAHGGMVTVRSEPGEGSEFALVLPVPPWPALPAGQPGQEQAAADDAELTSAG